MFQDRAVFTRGISLCLLMALIAFTAIACVAPPFRYTTHSPPRVFVSHSPILPDITDGISIRAEAEVVAGASVRELLVQATVFIPSGHRELSTTCATTSCNLPIASTSESGFVIYSARVTDNSGRRASSASAYIFQIGDIPVQNVILRAPIDLYQGRRTFRVLLVRDDAPTNYPLQPSVLADIERLLYEGVYADPIYRWRDNQVAFYLSKIGGTTSGYSSGLVTRCGQDPWIARDVFSRTEAERGLESFDTLVVLHRQNGPDWRDCSGISDSSIPTRVLGASLRAASADGRAPEVFVHELGHALLGLSDEYTESTLTREAVGGPMPPFTCRCCDPSLGEICLPGQRRCDEPPPVECLSAEPSCPRLGTDCRGNENVFESLAECNSARTAIETHPGIELSVSGLSCRILCAAGACPCEPAGSTRELWILDEQEPATPTSAINDDVMGVVFPALPIERHGPACSWCAETRFCFLWETGRGRTVLEAESQCLSP